MGFPGGSDDKEFPWKSPCNAGDLGLIPGLGGSPAGGHGDPLQYFLFLIKKKKINWRIVALQNVVVFCHTSTRVRHKCTHVPSLLDFPPISLPIPHFSLSQSPCLSSLSHIAKSHWLSVLQWYYKFLHYSESLGTEEPGALQSMGSQRVDHD